MSLKFKALASANALSRGLYGSKLGSAFHAVTAKEILLESIRFVVEDIKGFMDAEEDTTIRECIYPAWYQHFLQGAEGVFSDSTSQQNMALNDFFKPKVRDETSFWREGLIDVRFTTAATSLQTFEADKKLARPFRMLTYVFQGSEDRLLDDTHLSTKDRWTALSIHGKRDRIGAIASYEFV